MIMSEFEFIINVEFNDIVPSPKSDISGFVDVISDFNFLMRS